MHKWILTISNLLFLTFVSSLMLSSGMTITDHTSNGTIPLHQQNATAGSNFLLEHAYASTRHMNYDRGMDKSELTQEVMSKQQKPARKEYVPNDIKPEFKPIPSNYGIDGPNPMYALDISYDTIEPDQQAFHLFLPDTVGPYPLVIHIHGGGFQGGSRNDVLSNPGGQASIQYFLERGIAFASIGYRLLPRYGPTDTMGVIKPLHDAKRALQFMRYYADDLFINPAKIALRGGSAGAGTSLWLATRADMANPKASDPVLRQSTRVCAVSTRGSQATYDLYKWETEVYHNFDGQDHHFTLDSMSMLIQFDRYSSFYGGIDSIYHILHDSTLIQYRQDVDMLYHMSSDDPPVYIYNNSKAIHPSQDLLHHSFHARTLYDTALKAKIPEVIANIVALGINNTKGETAEAFLERHLRDSNKPNK